MGLFSDPPPLPTLTYTEARYMSAHGFSVAVVSAASRARPAVLCCLTATTHMPR
jgi:hypothetical protein